MWFKFLLTARIYFLTLSSNFVCFITNKVTVCTKPVMKTQNFSTTPLTKRQHSKKKSKRKGENLTSKSQTFFLFVAFHAKLLLLGQHKALAFSDEKKGASMKKIYGGAETSTPPRKLSKEEWWMAFLMRVIREGLSQFLVSGFRMPSH